MLSKFFAAVQAPKQTPKQAPVSEQLMLPNIEFLSVGGGTSNRLKRDGLLQQMEPSLNSAALYGSKYDKSKKGFFIEDVITWDMIQTCKVVKPTPLTDGDVLFIIGHCGLGDIEKVLPVNPFDKITIAAQGYGFNFTKDTHTTLQKRLGKEKINVYPAEVCPRWTAAKWEKMMSTYPEELKVLRCSQFVAFFTGRKDFMVKERKQEDGTNLMTSAFYNQFGIIPKNPEFVRSFELAVINKLLVMKTLDENGINWCHKMIEAFTFTPAENVKDILVSICTIYKENPMGPQYYNLMKVALQETVEQYSIGIKEYDSFALNSDIHHKLGWFSTDEEDEDKDEYLNGTQHFNMMMRILTGKTNASDEAFKAVSRKYYSGKKIVVLHDLGLDPMNDDWLAIQLLKYLFC